MNVRLPVATFKFHAICGIICIAISSAVTQAAIIDFEDVSPSSAAYPCFGAGGSGCTSFLDSGGFRFTSPDNGFTNHAYLVSSPWYWILPPQSYPSNGTQYIGLDPSIIMMSKVDGTPFNLLSVDAAEGFIGNGALVGAAAKLQIEGNVFGGGIETFVVDFDGFNDGVAAGIDFQTFTLPGTFTNLSSVTFRGLNASGATDAATLFSVDNISVSAAMPLPATLWLFGLGLLTLLGSSRNHRSL